MKKPLEEHLNKLTSDEKAFLNSLKDRIQSLVSTYGSLAKAGRSPFESLEEVAVIYKLISNGVSYGELAKFLGVNKVSIYRWSKSLEQGKIAIYNKQKGVTETVEVSKEKLNEILEKISKAKAKKHLKVVTDSKKLQEFVKKPVAIQRSRKRFYTKKEVEETLEAFQDVADYIKANQEKLKQRYGIDIPSNPDYWANNPEVFEEIITDVVLTMCLEQDPSQGIKFNRCKAKYFGRMKRVKEFRNWFVGMIGRVTNRIERKEATLYLKDVYRLRKIVEESNDKDLEAFYWCAILHITTGSREGWESIKNKVLQLESQGIELPKKYEKPWSLDLDDEFVDTSLIGIKWKNVLVDPRQRRVLEIKIFERKTRKWAVCKYLDLIDERLPYKLYEFYEYARKHNIQSVVKTIVKYYGLVRENKVTVNWFKNWYTRHCSKLKKMLQLPWNINPHRLRSAHVSILAELRIPLELVLDHDVGFGVGWDDLTTAKVFYLRISETLILDYLRKAYEEKQKILTTY